MSEKAATEKPKLGSGSESPTTARELDFDDDDEAPAGATSEQVAPPPPSKSPKPGVRFSEDATEIPPPKPPRPANPHQQAESTLIEAFPGLDPVSIKGILFASDYNLEKAFAACLSITDPSFQAEEAPPPQPPRPRQPRNQVEADEIYARQLAEHYQSSSQGYGSRGAAPAQRKRQQTSSRQNQEQSEDEYDFFKDDLPEIRKEIEKGFSQAQSSVKKFIKNISDKFESNPDDYDDYYGDQVRRRDQRQDFGPSQSDQLRGIRRSADARRSADRERYDNDNRVLGDDFEALELRDDEAPANQRSNRPLANPDLFKPTPVSPPQSGPVDEVDALYRNPSPHGQQTGVTGNKSGGKKWQPLTSIAPNPETDEHDPFSLGDSDDEDAKTKDIKAEDTERLKKAAEAKEVKESTGAELSPAGRSGSVGQIDAAAEALLKDTK